MENGIEVEIQNITDLPQIEITEGTVNLYRLLVSCNMIMYFDKFVSEGFQDDSIEQLDPDKRSFWDIIPKIITKVGDQIRFEAALKECKEKMKAQENVVEAQENVEEEDEQDLIYTPFNDHEVCNFYFIYKIYFKKYIFGYGNVTGVFVDPWCMLQWILEIKRNISFLSRI